MRFFLISLIFFILVFFSSPLLAQASPGITVTPSLIRLDLSQAEPDPSRLGGRSETEAEVFYKNNTASTVELTFLAQDFSPEQESGRVRFLSPPQAQNYQYALASWITFERQSITLSAGEERSVRIFINPDKLTAGGHYASLQARLAEAAKEGQVPVNFILSTLIFVRAGQGGEVEAMTLQSLSPSRNFWDFPETFLLRLQNRGNVELVPQGLIEIKDLFGRVVAKGIINEGSLFILPESIRRFDVPVRRLSRFLLPGLYKAEASIHFGSEDKNIAQRVSFVSLGSLNFLPGGLILGAAVLFWRQRRLKLKIGPRP